MFYLLTVDVLETLGGKRSNVKFEFTHHTCISFCPIIEHTSSQTNSCVDCCKSMVLAFWAVSPDETVERLVGILCVAFQTLLQELRGGQVPEHRFNCVHDSTWKAVLVVILLVFSLCLVVWTVLSAQLMHRVIIC